MPIIDPKQGHLTVINLFKTNTHRRVDRLIQEMCTIVDAAAFPGWISSTVHRGEAKRGTLNFIQWRGSQDLESRYSAGEFKHRTVPVFQEITTFIRLMQTEVELSQRHPSQGRSTRISPNRDDYTVVEILGVAPDDQCDLVKVLGRAHEWLVDVPGYRSQTVMRGVRSRSPNGSRGGLRAMGTDNDFVVVYSQWQSKQSFEEFRAKARLRPLAVWRQTAARRRVLTTASYWNAYQVVHTRSAPASERAPVRTAAVNPRSAPSAIRSRTR